MDWYLWWPSETEPEPKCTPISASKIRGHSPCPSPFGYGTISEGAWNGKTQCSRSAIPTQTVPHFIALFIAARYQSCVMFRSPAIHVGLNPQINREALKEALKPSRDCNFFYRCMSLVADDRTKTVTKTAASSMTELHRHLCSRKGLDRDRRWPEEVSNLR